MRQFFIKIILVLAGLILGFAILEVCVRLLPEPAQPRLLELIEPDQYIGTIYKKNLDSYVEAEDGNGTISFRTNERGFIGPNWNMEKGGLRIVNHGDSFTAGVAVPYEKNYVSVLGNTLSELIKKPVKSINLGIVGQGTGESLETYRQYGRQAGGDIIILWMYLGNDFLDNVENFTASEHEVPQVDEVPQSESEISFIIKFLKKSKLLFFVKDTIAQAPWGHRLFLTLSKIPGMKRFIYQVTLAEYPPKIPLDLLLLFTDHEKNRTALEETKKYIQEFLQAAREDGGQFFVVLVPAHFQVDQVALSRLYKQYPELPERGFNVLQPNHFLGEILETLSIPYLDLTPVFIDAYAEDSMLYICRFCHLNEAGHSLAGKTAARWLYENYFAKVISQ